MTVAMQEWIGISNQRGFWLRCFLGSAIAAVIANTSFVASAQVDCVYPGRVAVSRVQGQVFDPFGAVVPGVVITLVNAQGLTLKTTTDAQGRFHVAASPGKYFFKAVFPMFQTSQTELSVGEDLVGPVHSNNLYVIMGLSGSYCAWVTTSPEEFQQIIGSNKKRSEESTQRNATQK